MNRCLFVLFISTAIAAAHSGNRVFPFYQLTDEMLEKIDIHDGSVEEWHEIGEPSMTLLDFQTVGNFIPPDPSNLDARIWLAWHDESNRIYAAFVIIDDTYHNTNDVTESMYWSDSVTLSIDADHSGGSGRSLGCPFLVALSTKEAFLAGGAALHPVGSFQPSEPNRVARRQVMPRFMKHLVAAVLLAGGVLLAVTSFVESSHPWW